MGAVTPINAAHSQLFVESRQVTVLTFTKQSRCVHLSKTTVSTGPVSYLNIHAATLTESAMTIDKTIKARAVVIV
jgi:hypothetical protein